jgi:hypothetical protein
MSDVPFTNDDERDWVDDGRVDDIQEAEFRGGLDDTGDIDARVLADASEFDAVEQRRALGSDDDHDDHDPVLPDDDER